MVRPRRAAWLVLGVTSLATVAAGVTIAVGVPPLVVSKFEMWGVPWLRPFAGVAQALVGASLWSIRAHRFALLAIAAFATTYLASNLVHGTPKDAGGEVVALLLVGLGLWLGHPTNR